MSNKRLFFSLEGVDINDDDALRALAAQVLEQATAAWEKQHNDDESTWDSRE